MTVTDRPRRDHPDPAAPVTRAQAWQTWVSWDPLVALQVYIVVLILSPSIYIIKPLGAAGTPATILGVLFLVLWVVGRLTEHASGRIRPTPLHWLLGAVSVAAVLSLLAGMLRPTTSAEVSSALRGLIMLASWCGVILLVSDSLRTKGRLGALLRMLVFMGAVLATMGIVQYFFGVNFVTLLHLPGLTQNGSDGGTYVRSGFPRVSGTSLHSIEFAAVLGIILPAAIHLAFNGGRGRIGPWLQLALIVFAVPLTVSRSGMLAIIVGVGFALVIASARQRWAVLATVGVGAIAFSAVLPGLLGTIRELFFDAAEDQSVYGRLRDYEAVEHFFGQSPWIGRGFFTFLPDLYRTLDNQFLGILVEQGIIGLVSIVLLLGGSIAMCIVVGRRTPTRFLRTQSYAIAAGLFTGTVLFATFDFFGFPMAMGTFSILIGAAGASWHIHRGAHPRGVARTSADVRRPRRAMRHRLGRGDWTVVAAVSLVVLLTGVGAISAAQDSYEAKGSIVVGLPAARGQNTYDSKIDAPGMSDVLVFVMESAAVQQGLREDGVTDYTVAVGDGSLEPFTEVDGTGPMIWISARATSADGATAAARTVKDEVTRQLSLLQTGRGIPPGLRVVVGDAFIEPDVVPRSVETRGAVLALTILVLLAAFLTVGILRSRPAPAPPTRHRERAAASP